MRPENERIDYRVPESLWGCWIVLTAGFLSDNSLRFFCRVLRQAVVIAPPAFLALAKRIEQDSAVDVHCKVTGQPQTVRHSLLFKGGTEVAQGSQDAKPERSLFRQVELHLGEFKVLPVDPSLPHDMVQHIIGSAVDGQIVASGLEGNCVSGSPQYGRFSQQRVFIFGGKVLIKL